MSEIKRDTHVVFKQADALKYLSRRRKRQLYHILQDIENGRTSDGKAMMAYYICNTDEPYASEVLDVILKGEDKKKAVEG